MKFLIRLLHSSTKICNWEFAKLFEQNVFSNFDAFCKYTCGVFARYVADVFILREFFILGATLPYHLAR